MKRILVPVGNVENGVTNLRYAVQFASLSGATVYLVNIYREFSKVAGLTKVNELIIEESEAQLKKVVDSVDTKDVQVITRAIKGNPFEALNRISKQLDIDLMIVSPQSVDKADEVFLGGVTGKIIKQTEIPVLVIPKEYIFRKIDVILMAFKSGQIKADSILDTVASFKQLFSAKLNLLHVVTPDNTDEDLKIDERLETLKDNCKVTENATIFQGLLEHFQSNNPDMLCVIRRKRGFFKKIWEKNLIYKKEFHTSKPLLVLRGKE
ncbi:MAG: universal stress protein [Gilvibacter sp.]